MSYEKKRLFHRLFVFAVIIFVSVYLIGKNINRNSGLSLTASNQKPTHSAKFYDEKSFIEAVNKSKNDTRSQSYHISGGIIPHHLFASFIIADFFKRLSFQKPDRIILLGPNHYEKGDFNVLTSLYNWDTPFGIVESDEIIINNLIDNNLIKTDEEVLPDDHSLTGIMPFIKYYLPEVKVIPILLSGRFSKDESRILANNLSDFITKNTVVIAAVDFSHYLNNNQAQEKDKITLEVMKDFDYQKLYSFNDDYLDSPPSIGVLLMIMQNLSTTNMDLLYHANSGELQNNNYIETTSYFSLFFH